MQNHNESAPLIGVEPINYPTCGSVVSLTGHINSNKDTIDTIAIIAHQASITNDLGAQFITHDIFLKDEGN